MNPPEGKQFDPDVLDRLRERASGDNGFMPFEDFMDCVLYDPDHGYYRRQRQRVGHRGGSDFYTASSLGPLFSKLVLASIEQLIGESLGEFTFIEAGPESPKGILGALGDHPFAQHVLIRPGDPFKIPPKAIVFSNELFDAQPFRRFVRRSGKWLEAGVAVGQDHLDWVEVEPLKPLPGLPDPAPEGYTIDWPGKAHALLESICRQPWEGLFIAFDYGLERSTIFSERPEGTGRTYAAHKMGQDLLANPGHTDLTCHVIWDELEKILQAHHFAGIQVQRQESFFMRHGTAVVESVLAAAPGGFSREKQTLMELLHPDNMGHKFQVLSARRGGF